MFAPAKRASAAKGQGVPNNKLNISKLSDIKMAWQGYGFENKEYHILKIL